jgi:peptidylprolyl isomerase
MRKARLQALLRPRLVATALAILSVSVVLFAACRSGDGGPPPTGTADGQGPPPVSGQPITTGSGLQFIDIKRGTGDSPEPGETVVIHYTGWLEDGTKFESSLDSGQPASFKIGEGDVIEGWDIGVATMQVGGKRRLIIPPHLAYGEAGRGPVPPNATLIFDIELLEVR